MSNSSIAASKPPRITEPDQQRTALRSDVVLQSGQCIMNKGDLASFLVFQFVQDIPVENEQSNTFPSLWARLERYYHVF